MSSTTLLRSLNIHNINPHIKEAKYAVRGELAVRSEEYRARLAKGDKSLPFDQVISANIGNPQQLDQKPITFFRQVLSLVEYPPLLEREDVLLNQLGYKTDVIERARWLLETVGSVGAYSASAGAPGIKQSVAKFLERRDGFSAEPKDIYLSGGASSGVNTLLHIICASPKTGVLVPIPQYPLYSASLSGKFHSFKRGLRELQKADSGKYQNVELASLHSISKGMVGECGHRGGYFELCGFDPEVQEEIYKFVSISLCAPVVAQCLVEMMVNPPQEGSPSYELYKQEYNCSDRSINIFAGFTRDFAPISQRFEDSQLHTTILAPRNSAIMALDRKPWEDPTGQDYAAFGAEAYEGAKGQERARNNLRRFVEAHVVERSPWAEGEKVPTRGGETLWWEDQGGVRVIQPGNIEVDSVASRVHNGEVWILKGVRNYT
ncbi:mitochondrial putative alanine aminotransferase [Diplocarpon rosae]|nr:mitochondrial putative alanine aminotransferase [Diplocarpon rosae]